MDGTTMPPRGQKREKREPGPYKPGPPSNGGEKPHLMMTNGNVNSFWLLNRRTGGRVSHGETD